MRINQLFGRTLRQAPAAITRISEQLLVRGGFIRKLPDRSRVDLTLSGYISQRLEALVLSCTTAFSPAEVGFPGDQPHEKLLALGRQELESYKDLPQLIFTRAVSKDGCQISGVLFSGASRDNDAAYMAEAFSSMLEDTCGTPVIIQMTDGEQAFGFEMADGHQHLFITQQGYAVTPDIAGFVRTDIRTGVLRPLETVATPGCKTISDLCDFLSANPENTLKAVFFAWSKGDMTRTVLAMLRGTLDVNENKLLTVLGGGSLAQATETQVIATGAVPGYASPIGLMVATSYGNEGLIVIGDPSLVLMDDSITGANIDGFHAIHASYPRDFTVTAIADIAHATDGNLNDTDGTALRETRADIVITCGPAISEAGSYLTEEGHSLPITALPFTINLTSWIEQIVEKHHDEAGILWPTLIAPFDIYLLTLAREDNTRIAGETIYRQLTGAGWRVLYDPRSLSPGAKFADADLIGCPVRIVVSDKSLMEDSVEIKLRQEKERQIILLKDLEEVLKTLIP